jgi:hypothetical protein
MSLRSSRWFLGRVALLATAALGAESLLPSRLTAQDALPRVEIRQVMNGGSFAFSSTGRVKVDRDAFVVVFEIGADGRARVLYPSSPRERGFARSDRPLYVVLPSADVPFIRAAELQVPVVVAFASDLEPDLSEFTESGRRWDYQYATRSYESTEDKVRGLAELLYGSADMPYAVGLQALSPVLSTVARRTLVSCGYQYGGSLSPGFNRFLWDLWGPVSLLETSWQLDQLYNEVQWGQWNQWNMGGLFAPQFLGFGRTTSRPLWDQYGSECDPLGRDFRYIALANPTPQVPQQPGPEAPPIVPIPKDRPANAPPGTVTDVGIELATPADMSRRAGRVTRGTDALAKAREEPQARGPLTRETTQDLVQRQQIERTMQLLTAQRAAGWQGSVNDVFDRVRAGQFDNDMNRLASRSGTNRSWTRASDGSSGSTGLRRGDGSSGSFGSGSSGGGAGSSSGGGSAAGSGSMSGGSEARGGGAARGGSGRGGTGRPGGE